MKTKTAPDLFKSEREAWIDECRAAARKLLCTRNRITMDDINVMCPRPQYVNKNAAGQVFKHPDFKVVGFTKSLKASRSGALICVWGLRNDMPFATRMIQRNRREAE